MIGNSVGPIVLIDGHNTFIRNYVRSPYTNDNGERMGGLTGMIISVRKIINDFRPNNVLVVWDGQGGSQRRKTIYKEYKEGRNVHLNVNVNENFQETPEQRLENMRKQRQLSEDYLTLLGVPQIKCDGVEADDIIAYISRKMNHDVNCIIVSTDQDMLQLIQGSEALEDDGVMTKQSEVLVYSPIKKILYDKKTFISEYSVLPENFRLVKSITGDKSDNIEGITGFGLKTIIKSFPNLCDKILLPNDILEAAADMKSQAAKNLCSNKDRFFQNLLLMDLSNPLLSATAARESRITLDSELKMKEIEFRVKISKDNITFGGKDFLSPFREFCIRRKKYLSKP